MLDKVEISIRDLEFDNHTFRPCRNKDGSFTQRWVPLGMPRVSAAMQRSVFFLFPFDARRGKPGMLPGATGFFVCRNSKKLHFELKHFYAVTNRHAVIECPVIRINSKSSGVRFIDFDPSEWIYSKTDDLAVADVTDYLKPDDKVSWVSEYDFASSSASALDARIGDQTIMLGLFADHREGAVNVPIGRFGNLAARPSDSAHVSLGRTDDFARPAFLNDMRSRTGFSGSPVWTWYSAYQDVEIDSIGVPDPDRDPPLHARLTLIGVHRGQFREPASLIDSLGEIEVASSMTVVVPAWEISKVLDLPELIRRREARDERPERIECSNNKILLMRRLEKKDT